MSQCHLDKPLLFVVVLKIHSVDFVSKFDNLLLILYYDSNSKHLPLRMLYTVAIMVTIY